MKNIYFFVFINLILVVNTTGQTTINFNSISDLTTNFNPSSGAIFTNGTSNGISNSGAVNVSLGTSENWTSKIGETLSLNNSYTVSVYVKINGNSGRGGIGFSNINTNTTNTFGHPAKALGFAFHGGGGDFVNNLTSSAVSWPPDLVQLNWYFMELTITYTSSNTFNIDFNIFNSDSNGNLGTLKTNKSFVGETNSDLGSATTLYPYFSHNGSRLSQIDNFSYSSSNVLSLDKNDFVNFKLYPNPARNTVNLKFSSAVSGLLDVKIYNVLGSLILTERTDIQNNNITINTSSLNTGVYFLNIKNKDKEITRKLIIE